MSSDILKNGSFGRHSFSQGFFFFILAKWDDDGVMGALWLARVLFGPTRRHTFLFSVGLFAGQAWLMETGKADPFGGIVMVMVNWYW